MLIFTGIKKLLRSPLLDQFKKACNYNRYYDAISLFHKIYGLKVKPLISVNTIQCVYSISKFYKEIAIFKLIQKAIDCDDSGNACYLLSLSYSHNQRIKLLYDPSKRDHSQRQVLDTNLTSLKVSGNSRIIENLLVKAISLNQSEVVEMIYANETLSKHINGRDGIVSLLNTLMKGKNLTVLECRGGLEKLMHLFACNSHNNQKLLLDVLIRYRDEHEYYPNRKTQVLYILESHLSQGTMKELWFNIDHINSNYSRHLDVSYRDISQMINDNLFHKFSKERNDTGSPRSQAYKFIQNLYDEIYPNIKEPKSKLLFVMSLLGFQSHLYSKNLSNFNDFTRNLVRIAGNDEVSFSKYITNSPFIDLIIQSCHKMNSLRGSVELFLILKKLNKLDNHNFPITEKQFLVFVRILLKNIQKLEDTAMGMKLLLYFLINYFSRYHTLSSEIYITILKTQDSQLIDAVHHLIINKDRDYDHLLDIYSIKESEFTTMNDNLGLDDSVHRILGLFQKFSDFDKNI